MQKLEDAVIPMNKNEVRYLVGGECFEAVPLPIYSDIVCEFLDQLSKELRKDAETKKYPDILTFAFWCRKANITRMKSEYQSHYLRLGRGVAFHIAPSNVPINFAFSLAFGMLAGNGNIVRVSEKNFPQIEIVCNSIGRLLEQSKFRVLKMQTQIISYGHVKEINAYYSAKCDVRVIWGGDATIYEIRKSPIKTRCTEITFADRFSFAIFDERALEMLEEKELLRLAEKFYNDTYLMDQNACSSPHLILWRNQGSAEVMLEHQTLLRGRERFWKALYRIAEKYDLPEKKVLDKFTIICEKSTQIKEIESVHRYGNLLYVTELSLLPKDIDELRGKFGLFYECELNNYQELCARISPKVQTCVVYGIDKEELLRVFVDNHITGIDRIVSVGEAMDIGVYWDGYDVIGSLSREIIAEYR